MRRWRRLHDRQIIRYRRRAQHLYSLYFMPGSPAENARWLRKAHQGTRRMMSEQDTRSFQMAELAMAYVRTALPLA
jgi:hypothetical protein